MRRPGVRCWPSPSMMTFPRTTGRAGVAAGSKWRRTSWRTTKTPSGTTGRRVPSRPRRRSSSWQWRGPMRSFPASSATIPTIGRGVRSTSPDSRTRASDSLGSAPSSGCSTGPRPAEFGGGPSIINAAGWNAAEGYAVDWVPSMRMVIDLGDLSRSTAIHTTGQSGHAFHANYADMLEMWADGDQHPMLWGLSQVEEAAANTLILDPGPG